jgi:hypothetical protein
VAQAFGGNGPGLGGGALHQESCRATGGRSGLRGAASPVAHGEMAAAGLARVAYGSCGEANPAWIVNSVSPLPPGLGYKIVDIPIAIARRSLRTMFPSCSRMCPRSLHCRSNWSAIRYLSS